MTDAKYEEARDVAAEEYHDRYTIRDTRRSKGFKDGVDWSRANPSPEVLALVEALKEMIYQEARTYGPSGKECKNPISSTVHGILIPALAQFEKAGGK